MTTYLTISSIPPLTHSNSADIYDSKTNKLIAKNLTLTPSAILQYLKDIASPPLFIFFCSKEASGSSGPTCLEKQRYLNILNSENRDLNITKDNALFLEYPWDAITYTMTDALKKALEWLRTQPPIDYIIVDITKGPKSMPILLMVFAMFIADYFKLIHNKNIGLRIFYLQNVRGSKITYLYEYTELLTLLKLSKTIHELQDLHLRELISFLQPYQESIQSARRLNTALINLHNMNYIGFLKEAPYIHSNIKNTIRKIKKHSLLISIALDYLKDALDNHTFKKYLAPSRITLDRLTPHLLAVEYNLATIYYKRMEAPYAALILNELFIDLILYKYATTCLSTSNLAKYLRTEEALISESNPPNFRYIVNLALNKLNTRDAQQIQLPPNLKRLYTKIQAFVSMNPDLTELHKLFIELKEFRNAVAHTYHTSASLASASRNIKKWRKLTYRMLSKFRDPLYLILREAPTTDIELMHLDNK